uniref:Integrase catalytic domain-containing protein n=1 Tax=Fagus sylvatica TaxID=28930 RepID=A0A2N9IK08_FAGSY
MDQRVEQLEQSVSSLQANQQQILERLTELFNKFSTFTARWDEGETSQGQSGRRNEQGSFHSGAHTNGTNQAYAHRVKLDFPLFNGGEDPTSEAQLWYQLLQQENNVVTWDVFKAGLLARYGPTQFYDYFGELTKLQQTGFRIKADVLAGRLGGPMDLSTAIGLARLYEAQNLSQRRHILQVSASTNVSQKVNKEESSLASRHPSAIRRMSPAELKERRDKGLCYNFEENEVPGISLHAMSGSDAPETMRVHGAIGIVSTVVLLDSGRSTHNFVSERLATKLNLQPATNKKVTVEVASGEKLSSKGLTRPKDKVVADTSLWHNTKKPATGAFLQLDVVREVAVDKSQLMPEVQELLDAFSDLFEEPIGLPPTRVQDHRIPLQPGSGPVCTKPYRYPYYQKMEIERLVTEMLSTRVIRPSNSPFSSPVILVKKSDGSWRMCVDYRSLNQMTIKDKFPIPAIDELLDELHGACYFSKLDLRSGYHQIQVLPEDVPKTAFRTHHGHFEFLVMPFRLTNAPSTFQALMNEGLPAISEKHLQVVLETLQRHQLHVKRSKCEFGQQRVQYLGHIISPEGVSVDPDKVVAMVQWPKPHNPKSMRGFLGLTGYYRKFIQSYGKIAAPLTQMLKKNSFVWSPKAEDAFQRLKDAMTKAPVLALPDFTKVFIVECDASGSGIGAVLQQERPIAFHSQALHGKNLLLSTYEKEMLALVMAIKKWRHYLLGRRFVVRTDHRSLQYLWSQKITTEAQQKWLHKLMGFDFKIEYKQGRYNCVADALSRRFEDNEEGQIWAISTSIPHWLEANQEEHKNSSMVQEILQRTLAGEAMGPWEISRRLIRECEVCQKNKVEQLQPAGLLQPLPIPTQIWDDISMDFIDGLPASQGKSTILVVVDRLSKYSHFIPISHPYTAVSIAQIFFEHIFKLHGMPKSIVCNRDVTFTSSFWKELFRLNGTSFNFSSSYHPQTDGQSEVVNKTLEMYLRCFSSSNPKQWVKWLPCAEFCCNTSWHSAIKRIPFEVVYGRDPPSLLTYVTGTAKVAAVEEELVRRDQILTELKEHIKAAQTSVTRRRDSKLAPRYYGLFQILQSIGKVAYKLALPADSRIHPVFHVSVLKEKLGAMVSSQPQLLVTLQTQDGISVRPQAILEQRKRRGQIEILIHWQGLSPSKATWEDLRNMKLQFPNLALEDKGPSTIGKDSTHYVPGWSSIWAVPVQPKVKLFIWRACKTILPTQTKLFDKGVSHTYSCLWCGDEAETVDHLLWGCEFAQRVWKASPAMIPPSYQVNMPFTEFISGCIDDLGSLALEITFTTAWALWKARNDLIWNAKNSTVSEICQYAAKLALDFLETRKQCEIPSVPSSSILRWMPPAVRNYKLNLSCRVGSACSQTRLGVLIRDSLGLVMAAKCYRHEEIGSRCGQSRASEVNKSGFSFSSSDWGTCG